MPEGDTIFRAAGNLRKVLEGQQIQAASGRPEVGDVDALVGRIVTAVEVCGKHLLLHFSGQRVLHSHMGMTGSWHIYRPDDVWHLSQSAAGIQLQTSRFIVVCFAPKILQLVSQQTLSRNSQLQRLGPDILGPKIADDVFLSRMRTQNVCPVGEAILNQTVVCGIGNVYKSEVLFLECVHPGTRVADLADDCLLQLLNQATFLMKRNLDNAVRRTRFRTDAQSLWVYGRQGEACLKCGTPIQMMRQGAQARSTYFCPTCQPCITVRATGL
ncbi:MAG: DNA-formamidopyrimidine glycosylase family protein [Planctomycetaceae bacterium]